MSLQAGQIIEGKYRIVRLLGEGGMGAVYEGENVRIHRRVAIKVLHANVASNVDAVQRFEREAQAAGRIGSDHIVEVIDLGNLSDGDRFMVMEFLDGESLSDRIQSRTRLSPQEAVPLMVQLLEGLGAAHGAGIIHRDLKPDNVYIVRSKKGRSDFVKILDFGISKFNRLNADSGMSMTRTGAVMGTPYYMSPEQAKGSKEMDHRSDLYSAGVILYEAITGQVPFNAETFNELIFKIALETAPPPQTLVPGLDPNFASIVQKSMAREQKDRFQSAQEFADALTAWAGTGRGVAVPAVAPMPPPRAPAASAPMLGQTPVPWAQTGGPGQLTITAHAPKKGRAAPVIASVVALAVAGIGGAFVFQLLRKPDSSASPAVLASPANAAQAVSAPPAVPAEAPKPEPVAKPAELPNSDAPAASTAATPVPAAPFAAGAGAFPGAKRPPGGAVPTQKHTPEKPAAAPAPPPVAAAPPPPAPPAATPAPTSTGRKIRTEL